MQVFSIILLSCSLLVALTATIGAIADLSFFFKKGPLNYIEHKHGHLPARLLLGAFGGGLLIFSVLMIVVLISVIG